nr:hypothetical protein GCM10025699_24920 [Microbacterium flavescens]
MVGQAGLLDREIEVAEDRGQRRAELVRDRGDELVARAQRFELRGHIAGDDHRAGVVPARVDEPTRTDAQRLARARLLAEPHDLAVEGLAAQRPLDRQLVRRRPRLAVVAEHGHALGIVVAPDRLLQSRVRLVRHGDAAVGVDADNPEVDGVEHLGDDLLLPSRLLQHAPQKLRLLRQQRPLRVGPPCGQVARGGDRDEHEGKQQRREGELARGEGRQDSDDGGDRHDDGEEAEHAESGCEPHRREDPQQAERGVGRGDDHERDGDDVDRRDDGHPAERRRFQGTTSVAPVTTKTMTTPRKNRARSTSGGSKAIITASTSTTDDSRSWFSVAVRSAVRSAKSARSQVVRARPAAAE